jgi:hypothetical protein
VTAVAARYHHTAALKTDGSVVAWGWNNEGQTNVPVAPRSGVTAVATGGLHTVALKTVGRVVAWGYNCYGQATVPAEAQSEVTAIAAGGIHTVALKNDGSVIARAFSHLGKAYDFDFDFFSSDKLVCTELVYRCYDGSVQFPLVDVMGRRTLPPTELVRKFVTERGHAHAQLDCICFLDGDENQGMASFKDESTFATTLERPGLMLFPNTVSP